MNSIVHMLKKKNCTNWQRKLLILESALNPKKSSQVILGVLRNYLYNPNRPKTHLISDSIHTQFNLIHLGHHSFHP